jgi:uncharacterized protein (TIGR02453 family)
MDFPRLTRYLAGLAEHNEKAWFEANRAEFSVLREQFTAFVGEVIARLAERDESVRWVDPAECIFRIYRDVRFSRDKRPYKTTFSAAINERGRRGPGPSYYFEVDDKGMLVAAGGVYMPDADRLAAIREHIAGHPGKLRAVLRRRDFKETFGEIWSEDALKRPPRGYTDETPLIEQIKLKSYIVVRERDVSVASEAEVLDFLTETFHCMLPFLGWLRGALESARKAQPA